MFDTLQKRLDDSKSRVSMSVSLSHQRPWLLPGFCAVTSKASQSTMNAGIPTILSSFHPEEGRRGQ